MDFVTDTERTEQLHRAMAELQELRARQDGSYAERLAETICGFAAYESVARIQEARSS